MAELSKPLQEEFSIVRYMVERYCRDHHHPTEDLCSKCQPLLAYTRQRLQHCQYGDEKPFCSQCPIHCYEPKKRAQIRKIMRYSGPRMLFSHPRAALRHLASRFSKPKIPLD